MLATTPRPNIIEDGTNLDDFTTSTIRKWFLKGENPTKLSIQIIFQHMVAIRYVYTDWNVNSMTYRNEMSNGTFSKANIGFNYSR